MFFDDYAWNSVEIIDVFKVKSGSAGRKIETCGNTAVSQLGFKLDGDTEIFYGGEKINFYSGSVLYLPKEQRNDIDYCKTILSRGASLCVFFDSQKNLPPKPLLFPECGAGIREMFLKLLARYGNPGENTFSHMSVFFEILSELRKKSSAVSPENDMALAVDYMTKHVADGYIDFQIPADMYGISVDCFRRKFKQAYKLSPLQYYSAARIRLIKNLIRDSRAPFTDIAKMCGFSDLNYFSRFFKKHAGMSPSEYRLVVSARHL